LSGGLKHVDNIGTYVRRKIMQHDMRTLFDFSDANQACNQGDLIRNNQSAITLCLPDQTDTIARQEDIVRDPRHTVTVKEQKKSTKCFQKNCFSQCDNTRSKPAQASDKIANRTINRWPADERPREKLAATGAAALSDAELLAIFLRVGVPGQSAVDLGRTLLMRFGSLRALLSAANKELRTVHGMGLAKIAQLHAIGELAQRALAEELQHNTALDSPAAVRDYLRLLIGTLPHEVFVCLYLNARHHLICTRESSRGTLTHTAVYPREIARQALQFNAAALIIAHNHPSGSAEPSAADTQLTEQLAITLALFDIKLLDHFVVASNTISSFVEQGLL
jgi:DNA repair protein RadC